MHSHKKRWLRTTHLIPPGGWKFRDPDSQLPISAPTFEALKERVITHRTYLGNDTSNYPDEIEHQMCSELPESWFQDKPRTTHE